MGKPTAIVMGVGAELGLGAALSRRFAAEDGLLDIEAIADTFWHIHRQPRSAWAQEVDLRPFKEPF